VTVNNFVHCHICPLKDHCSFSVKDASWRWHNQGRHSWSAERSDEVGRIIVKEGDLAKLEKATSNCPLRRAVAYTETLQVKNLLRRST